MSLIVVGPAYEATGVDQGAVRGQAVAEPSSTPEIGFYPNREGITTTAKPCTTWESGKTTYISSSSARIPS